jgi:hypothetical protein
MSDFLEQLKLRLAEAQQRHQMATQRLQAAQQEHTAAVQDFASWQNAVRTETIREQQESAAPGQEHGTSAVAAAITPPQAPGAREEVNKTDAIRQLLRQHPEGLRPTDLWRQLGNQLKHRAYLYSVLKRLKDRQEVCERRGKYFVKVMPKGEDERISVAVVQ